MLILLMGLNLITALGAAKVTGPINPATYMVAGLIGKYCPAAACCRDMQVAG